MPKLLGDTAGAIGDMKHSMLTLAQFQARYGTGWVIADGASCVGSKYASITGSTTVPDSRGYFLRSANSGGGVNPDNTSVGGTQSDQFRQHSHGVSDPGHNHGILRATSTLGGGTIRVDTPAGNYVIDSNAADILSIQSHSTGISTVNNGGNENRPFSLTVNVFIRIN